MTRHAFDGRDARPPLSALGVGETVRLDGPAAKHAVCAMRVRAGELIDLVDGLGRRARVSVVATEGKSLLGSVIEIDDEERPPVRLVLVQALAKAKRDLMAVEISTELGVDEVIPWAAARCVATAPANIVPAKWVARAEAASEQSRRARFPIVHPVSSTAQLVETVRCATGRGEVVLVAHEDASASIRDHVAAASSVWVIVGPEGGLTPDEVSDLERAGARAIRLGTTIMRTSTAGAAVLAAINCLSGRW